MSGQEIQRPTEGELPEVKIFDLLSSVGNAENKALELIVMKEGVIYSRHALWQEAMSRQGNNVGWKMSESVPFVHCEKSLSPIGLVTKEALSPDDTAWGYEITQYGIRTGVPFAGVLLKWSYEHSELSLYKMFGSTQSRIIKDQQTHEKKRAQETRYNIFWEIATNNPNDRTRLTEIADAINEPTNLTSRGHLLPLAKNGVLSYETIQYGKPYSAFKLKGVLPNQEPEPLRTEKTLSARVYDLFHAFSQLRINEYLSLEQILNGIIQKHPTYKNLPIQTLGRRIIAVLTYLEKQEYLERRRFGHNFKSEIILTDEQKQAISSLITAIDKFKHGDREVIRGGREFAQRVVNDPKLFSTLMLKAKEASPQANSTSREDMTSHLISILHGHPNSTRLQIRQLLEKDYDKSLTDVGIRSNLVILINEGKIASERTKSGNVYRVVEEESVVQ